jgi:hypothetical protein
MLVNLITTATFRGDAAFIGPMTGVAAIRAEPFDGLVVTPLGIGDAAMAIVPVPGAGSGSSCKQKETAESESS